MIIPNTIEDLLIDFDERGFVPTNLIPIDSEEYAKAWRRALVEAIQAEHKEMLKDCIESNKAVEKTTQSRTAKSIYEKVKIKLFIEDLQDDRPKSLYRFTAFGIKQMIRKIVEEYGVAFENGHSLEVVE